MIFEMYKSTLPNKRSKTSGVPVNTMIDVVLNLAWIAQFCTMISWRQSHTGKVCSGDYAEI